MPDLQGLTQDPRYTTLPWEEKRNVLQRFTEDNPSPAAPVAVEMERLRHFSEDGTPASRRYHSSMLDARRKWYRSIVDGGDGSSADADFTEASKAATDAYTRDLDNRSSALRMAGELLDVEKDLELSFGNVALDVLDSINPVSMVDRFTEGESDRDKQFKQAQTTQAENLSKLAELGYEGEDLERLKADYQLARGAGGEPAAVDSHGAIAINDGALVLDVDSVRGRVQELAAPSENKRRTLNNLDNRRRAVIDEVFKNVAEAGGVEFDVDDDGVRHSPRISPLLSLETYIPNLGSAIKSFVSDNNDISRRAEISNEVSGNQIGIALPFTFEEREKAVMDLLAVRDDALDRARIGLSSGLLGDTLNLVATPFELAGSDFAASLTGQLSKSDRAFSSADRLVDISGTEEFIELGSRVVPQIILTRKVGNAGVGLAGRSKALQQTLTTAELAKAQARVGQIFATGYGGLLSGTFNARDVLDNGGSTGEALAAGILGFGTTFALANGFNAVGAGGVEQFRAKASASSEIAKRQLLSKLAISNKAGVSRALNTAKGAIGEGVEEFVDEFINGVVTMEHTGASVDDLVSNAMKGALLGSGFGGFFGARQPVSQDISASSSNREVTAAANKAQRELERADEPDPVQEGRREAAVILQRLEQRLADGDTLSESEAAQLAAAEEIIRGDGTAKPVEVKGAATEQVVNDNPTLDQPVDEDSTRTPEAVDDTPTQAEFVIDDEGRVFTLPEGDTTEAVEVDDPINPFLEEEPISDVRDSVFDTLNATEGLTEEQESSFDNRIEEAATSEELSTIEDEILSLQQLTVDESSTPVVEDQSVDEFLDNATPFQKQEFIRRFSDGEDQFDIIEDLSDPGTEELLTDEEIVADTEPIIMYGFMGIPSPALVKQAAESFYAGVKTLPGFAKKMLEFFGNKIRPIIRRLFHDMRRNNGKVKEATNTDEVVEEDLLSPEESEAADYHAQADEKFNKVTGIDQFRAQSDKNGLLKRFVYLPYEKVKEIASKSDGTDGTIFGKFLGRPIKWASFGILSKAQVVKAKEFYTDAVAALRFSFSLSERAAEAEIDALRAHFGSDVFDMNADGSVNNMSVPVEPFEVNGNTITESNRIGDIVTAIIADPTNPQFTPKMREFAAEWSALRNHTLARAKAAGVDVSSLEAADSPYDFSRLEDGSVNTHFPRGMVSNPNVEEGSRSGGGSVSAIPRSRRARAFSSEAEGVAKGYVYENSDPYTRMQQFVSEMNKVIAMHQFATDPDIVSNQEGFKLEKVTEWDNLDTGDVDQPVPVVRYKPTRQSKLNDRVVRLPNGARLNFRNSTADEIQDVMNGFVHPDNSHTINKVRKFADKLKGLKLVLDLSFLNIQLFGLSRAHPVRWAKTVGKSLESLVDGEQVRVNFFKDNPDLVRSYVEGGGMYSQRIDELQSIASKAPSTVRRNTLGRLEDAMMNALTIGSIYQYQALRETHFQKKGGITPELNASFVRMADRSVGREDLTRNGISFDNQLHARTLATAPGMYAGFLNGIADLASTDPDIRAAAHRTASRMALGTMFAFVGKSLMASMLDDEDERPLEKVLVDSAERLLPWRNNFMQIEIPIGDRRIVISEGGFYRSFFKMVADSTASVMSLDGEQLVSSYTSFMNSKKAPGLSAALEIYTRKDYFGNDISRTEAVISAFVPVSAADVVKKIDAPVIDFFSDLIGANLRSNSNILEDDLSWSETLRQTAFGLLGASTFVESKSRSYERKIQQASVSEFGRDYDELTAEEQYEAVKAAYAKGAREPDLTDFDVEKYKDYLQGEFEKNTRNPSLSVSLIEDRLMDIVVTVPKRNVLFDDPEIRVPIPRDSYIEMKKRYHINLEKFFGRNSQGKLDVQDVREESRALWHNELRSEGYPSYY